MRSPLANLRHFRGIQLTFDRSTDKRGERAPFQFREMRQPLDVWLREPESDHYAGLSFHVAQVNNI